MKSKIWLMFGLILVFSGTAMSQAKTVTNADLEKFKQKRLQAEAEYRAKYKELGMPSPEELEKRNIEDKQRLTELSEKIRYEQRQKEDYWQVRANYLRSEISSINAQINFLNRQANSLPNQNQIFYTIDQLNGAFFPSYGYGHGRYNVPQTIIRPVDNVQTVINAAAAAPNPFWGTPLYKTGIKLVLGEPQQNRGHRGYGRYNGYGYYPYVVNNSSSQRDEINSRLQYLGQIRAGLLAQWNDLVDEAHRAGVRLD